MFVTKNVCSILKSLIGVKNASTLFDPILSALNPFWNGIYTHIHVFALYLSEIEDIVQCLKFNVSMRFV